ncbi:MAG: VOC family protein [Woeseiaceae bacterium]|nr:VOC family protein [Woeseiaceae bacterium]
MAPNLKNVDHLHVDVGSWREAETWYRSVLGFARVEALMGWAVKNGPLTIENPEGTIHLALFESEHPETISAIAFGATGEEFLKWKKHLEGQGLKLRVTDHKLAYSLYFSDPWGNMHEITTYERDYVAGQLATANSSG